MFLGAFGTDVGVFGTSFMYAFRDRETIQDLFEEVTGERMMFNYFRPGGVAWDLPDDFNERARDVLDQVKRGLHDHKLAFRAETAAKSLGGEHLLSRLQAPDMDGRRRWLS